jgi:hypothetical protein
MTQANRKAAREPEPLLSPDKEGNMFHSGAHVFTFHTKSLTPLSELSQEAGVAPFPSHFLQRCNLLSSLHAGQLHSVTHKPDLCLPLHNSQSHL